jgi:hypothetical protein
MLHSRCLAGSFSGSTFLALSKCATVFLWFVCFLDMSRKVDEGDNFVFVLLLEQETGAYDKCDPDSAKQKTKAIPVTGHGGP